MCTIANSKLDHDNLIMNQRDNLLMNKLDNDKLKLAHLLCEQKKLEMPTLAPIIP
jgi:hypothetical protein